MFTSMRFYYLVLIFLLSSVLFSCKKDIETLDGFEIAPGFELSRVAMEPLIKDPVDLEFDELGNALVLEMPGYPFEDQESRIILLKDTDQDGIYDYSQVFVENLKLASSFLPYKKGVLVAAPPYLLFVRDEDQNYFPNQIDTLMGGFSTGNLQHNYNGLTYGLDGWIYAANGGNDGAPYWWGDTTGQMDLRGQDFRFNLETKALERLGESSGGYGLGVDEWGHIFETHNLTHISHLVIPDRYVNGNQLYQEHLLENISDHDDNGLARIYPIGEQESRVNHPEQSGYFSGSCGITHYGGGAFGKEYDHTIWVADVVLNLIHVDHITGNGASFKASRDEEKSEFLASNDRSFRPVNMSVGPNGDMFVVDMYRKVIEHPEWIPDAIEKTLDLEAGKDQGRIYRIKKTGTTGNFQLSHFQGQARLIENLSHTNQWVRMTAHRLLMDQQLDANTLKSLKGLLSTASGMGKLHALWLLDNKGELMDTEVIRALRDPSFPIRETALKLAEGRLQSNDKLLEICLALLQDPNLRVTMQAALSLSTLPQESFKVHQQQILNRLKESAKGTVDSWTLTAIVLASQDAAGILLTEILNSTQVKDFPTQFLASLSQIAGKQSDVNQLMEAIAKSIIPLSDKQLLIRGLTNQLTKSSPGLINSIQTLEQTGYPGLISELAILRYKLKLPPSAQFLQYSRQAIDKVMDDSLSDSIRLQQMDLLVLLPFHEKSNALFFCLGQSEPLKIQEKALQQLATINDPSIGVQVVGIWSELSPQTRRYASDLLLFNETHHDALLTGLEDGRINIGEMNFDLERRRQLLWWTDNSETKRRAENLFSDSGVSNRQNVIEQMKPALGLSGSVASGKVIFEQVCASCHRYGSLGNEVGPTLTEIGRKSKETLMHDILDPNAAADPQYINHRLETKEGIIHIGIIAQETDQEISIKKMGGENVKIPKSEVKSFRSLGTSLMMEGLENSMDVQKMADLLEFLQKGNL